MQKNLVIVESPAKAKTIEKFLGADYKVLSSYGHIRDLKKKEFSIDTTNFAPQYEIPSEKTKLVNELKAEAKNAGTVWLASDEDREGEAISWHLYEVLGLKPEQTKRIVFHEITKPAILQAIEHPRDIDLNLVNAQQARRVLDRIVGFKLSPVLWKKVKPALSAGRVQSVAVRLIVEREREIQQFKSEESYRVVALFTPANSKDGTEIKAELNQRFKNKEEATRFLESCKDAAFTIRDIATRPQKRMPAAPFTTSTLQQEAAHKLGFTVAQTMMIAQRLYESGRITYMRTDSVNLSSLCINASTAVIKELMGERYVKSRQFHTKTKGAQEAHEAIRPSSVTLTPEQVKGDLTGEQYRLYRLIWSRFLASQMANAVYDSVSVDIAAGEHIFRASASSLKFAGYTAVYEESRDDDKEDKEPALPELQPGEVVTLEGFEPGQHFTQPPARYTDATLIRTMEENGIGRPSTYAPTVSTILDREYVVKEGKALRITPLGQVVTDLMCQRFPDIVDVKFTARMEDELDEVESGKIPWKQLLRQFYGGFEGNLRQVEKDMEGVYLKVPDEVTEEKCDVCGRNMVVKSGRFGRFLACPGYPECTFTKPLVVEMPGRCPKCGGRLMKRTGVSKKTGKQYTYYCCERLNAADESARCDFMTWDVPVKDDCPVCGHTMFKKAGKGFRKPFCINPECSSFLPEDKRGYVKKTRTEEPAEGTAETPVEPVQEEKKPTKKAAKTTKTTKTAKTTRTTKTTKTTRKKAEEA